MNGTLNGKRQASSSTYLPCLDAWVTSWFLSILFLIHLPFSFPASPCSPAAPASPVVICVSCGRRAGLDLAACRRKLHRFPACHQHPTTTPSQTSKPRPKRKLSITMSSMSSRTAD
ncbi:hypothetical protein CMEL01_13624 [Colletotrichum melonis]|uniref:Uncharacterized protein n=1 Tax=Colletotrichum melonis TaxID=1209925 RepID=A0AAI9UQ96_9PEZI|nr:hypothetical protein CMEL01_13624 [Colletotrichum melonis]